MFITLTIRILSQNSDGSIENIWSSDNILAEYQILIHHIEVNFTINPAIPLEIFVSGVINHCTPTVVNFYLKEADQRPLRFGETEIVIEAVVACGCDSIGEVYHQGVTFTERYGVGFRPLTTTAIQC